MGLSLIIPKFKSVVDIPYLLFRALNVPTVGCKDRKGLHDRV